MSGKSSLIEPIAKPPACPEGGGLGPNGRGWQGQSPNIPSTASASLVEELDDRH